MKFEFKWKEQLYDCEWFDNTDFESLNNVIQAYGFIFNDEGKICIVNVQHNEGGWCLPGGGPEECDESFEDTLIREVNEEADLDICNIERVGYVKVFPKGEPEKIEYAVRYVARVDKIKEQSVDPAHGKIPLRKFISVEDFMNETGWNNDGIRVQLNKAVEVFEKNKGIK